MYKEEMSPWWSVFCFWWCLVFGGWWLVVGGWSPSTFCTELLLVSYTPKAQLRIRNIQSSYAKQIKSKPLSSLGLMSSRKLQGVVVALPFT